MKVLILYYSKTGHTLEAANATADGIRSSGSEADLVAVSDFKADTVADYDALIVGSPCWAGSVTSNGVARPVMPALNSLPPDCLKDKRCGAISVHCAMGGETTIKTLGSILSQKGCCDFSPGPSAKAGTPVSLWKGAPVTAADKERFASYGAAFVA